MARHPAVGFHVLRNVRVEQVKRDGADIGAPHLGQHVALANRDFDAQRRTVFIPDQRDRQLVGKSLAVVFLLPTVIAQSLAEVTVAIKQTDGD